MAEPFYRADARAKVTGHARYGLDLDAPRMLVGGLVRARVPAGTLVQVDTSDAARMPGVVVVTADDFPTSRYGMVVDDQPPLARDVIRYAGEPVVAIAAPDDDTLQAAREAVTLRIEPGPYVTTPEQALAEDAPLVHEDLASYVRHFPVSLEGNVCGRSIVTSGDVEAAFAAADRVVEGRYSTPRVHQSYIEPRSCLVTAEPDGGYLVETSTQNPFGVRTTLAAILAVPESKIHVRGTVVGGGFGGKLDVTLEHVAAVLARVSGRPVKVVSSRAEEFVAGYPREHSVVVLRTALDAEGNMIGRQARCLLDAGAYAHDTPFIGSVASLQGGGPYRIPNVRCEAVSVYTNTQPTGAYRGPSGVQMVFAVESHMDEIAAAIGEDPVAFRRRHLYEEGDRAPNGQVVENVSAHECLDAALQTIGYGRDLPDGHGIGIACAWWTTTGGPTGATVAVENDGTVTIRTGATEIGSGAVSAGLVALAAEEFDVPVEQVRLTTTSDTGASVYDFGAQGSRTTFNVGNAVLKASAEVRVQLFDAASDLLEVAAEDLELRAGRVSVVGAPDRGVTLAEVAMAALNQAGPVHASARFLAPPTPYEPSCTGPDHFYPAFHSPSFHCHAAEVAVDGDTGRVRIVRYVAVQDVGRAIVRPAIEGQVQGGVVQAIGHTLYEQEELTDGVPSNASFETYKVPTAMEAPNIEVVIVERPSTVGPRGAKGVGEPPIIVPAAAIVNGIAAATGRRYRDLPVTPERILGIVT